MNIRNARAADFEEICELLSQLWPEADVDTPECRKCLDRGLQSPNQVFLCAVVDGVVVGFGSLNVKNNLWQQGLIGHVDELIVDEACRGRGIGSALLRRLEQVAAEMGCKRLELDSAHHRKQAHSFYENLGFEDRAALFSKRLQTPDTAVPATEPEMLTQSGFPTIVTSLPMAEIPIAGVSSYLIQGEDQQVLFMSFDRDVDVPEHSHEAQWGVVIEGRIELTIGGECQTLTKGDSYFIPKNVAHSARIASGYTDLTLFDQKDRYRPANQQTPGTDCDGCACS